MSYLAAEARSAAFEGSQNGTSSQQFRKCFPLRQRRSIDQVLRDSVSREAIDRMNNPVT